ncbi:GT4 family glycosyltransferase [Paludisphaera borealis]|uniref:GT4 family glycosyltransferase n=2 Tax=Paludisphaera borealis TaxID=1387353 RepID=A0A1U7CWP1_9BACT|nr:GT4 family glycosyltransferase [Paludisphaera borealis]
MMMLARTVMEDGMRLLALVDSPDHVCCRYRIRAFEPALRDAGCSLVCQPLERYFLPRLTQLRDASRYHAVILQRKLLPSWQLALLRRHARHLIFDFDDAVLYRDSYDRRGPHSARRERRFAATVRLADTVIAGNDFLADCALRAGAAAESVRTIPTCVDPIRYLPRTERPTERGERPIELVWIGSSSTLKGLESQRTLWERLGGAIPGLRLRVVCDRFPDFQGVEVVPVPWTESNEAAELARGDLGVSWLPDDDWSRGKCGLKILQYQAAGLPTIANPVGAHVEMIEPGATGFLASTPDQWIEAVRAAADPAFRAEMGRAARSRVETHYSIAAWAPTFVASATGVDHQGSSSLRCGWSDARPAAPTPFVFRRRANHEPEPPARAVSPEQPRREQD